MSEKKVSCSCGGCIGLVVTILIVWALIFGVTIDGKHHGITCTSDKGVVVE